MKLSRVATLLSPTVLLLIAFNSSASYDSELTKKLANYPNLASESSAGECETIIGVADRVANLREQFPTSQDAKQAITQAVKSGEVTEEYAKPFLLLFDMVYSPEHANKSTDKITEDVEHLCKKPDVRLCDDEINASVLVHELKNSDPKYKNDLTVLTREVFQKEGFSSMHFELLEMLFWPEHAEKNVQAYSDFVANEWCANYSKRERTQLHDKRMEELGL